MTRDLIVAANWKMYKTVDEALRFVETLSPHILKSQVKVYIAAPFTALYPLKEFIVKNKIPVHLGAQNMYEADEGAFTGEISVKMIKDAGAEFVILGHSERRHIFHETDELINKKIKKALETNLQIIFCVGELGIEREKGETEKVLERQIRQGLEGISDIKNLIISYEPVWAIGTGNVAKPEDAEKAQSFCRHLIKEKFGSEMANRLVILYGGSVKPDNVGALIREADVDGFLVGGASLNIESFKQIIFETKKLKQA